MSDLLAPILERKRREIERRRRHREGRASSRVTPARVASPEPLRRPVGGALRVIAEVKFRSPSAGPIRAWSPGSGVRVARGYVEAGAAAVSVLCDRVGFGGSPLELRRVAAAVAPVPVLFKEFVLDPLQIDLAASCGASMALLLVCALDDDTLERLVTLSLERGIEPVVEAATERELERALRSGARVIGINARDLTTFRVDPDRAERLVEKIPKQHVAVYMSGVNDGDDLREIARGRADAVLVGSALMRTSHPGATLRRWLASLGYARSEHNKGRFSA